MKTIENIRATALWIAPWIIGITILFGCTMIFPSMAYNYANSKTVIIEIGMAIIIAIGLITIPWSYFKNITKSKIIWGMGAFLLVSLIATLLSVDKTLSWYSHLERGTGMFFMLLVSTGSSFIVFLADITGTLRKAVLYPIAIASAVIGLSTIIGTTATGLNIVHWLVLGSVAGGGGLTGNSSFAGSFLMLAVFIIGYLFFTTQSTREKSILGILGIMTIFNPVLFGGYQIYHNGFHGILSLIGDAQGAVISLALGVIITIGIYVSYAQKNIWKWFGRILAGGMIIVTIGALVLLVTPNTLVNKFFVNTASGTRFLYWDIALQSAKAHPIIGIGPETFRYAHEAYFNPDFMRKTFKRELYSDKPHNAFLEILVTTGILGSIAYLVMIGTMIWVLIRLAKNKENRIFVASISGFLFAYLLNNFILFDTAISFLVFFLVLSWLAISERASNGIINNNSQINSSGFIIRSIFGVIIIAATLGIVIPEITKLDRILVEMYAPLETRVGLYQKAESVSPYGAGVTFAQQTDIYSQNYLNHMQEILASSPESQKAVLADVNALLDQINIGFTKFPRDTQAYVDIGRLESIKILLANKANPDVIAVMIDAGNQIKKLSPRNPQAYWIIGQAYEYEGKFQEALDAFNAGVAIDPQIPESHQTIIELAQVIGDKKLYDQAVADYNSQVISADR